VTAGLVVAGLTLGAFNNHITMIAHMPGLHYVVEPHNPLSYTASWDAVDYISIARHGYTSLFWVNWFPLYPITIHTLDYVVPSPLLSALFIAWASLVGAIYFYIKIARRIFHLEGELEPLRALIFFVLFPTAVFLIAPFTESLYAMLALGAINFALKRRYVWASLFCLLATATHVTGLAVVALVGLILLEERVKLTKAIVTCLIGSIGLVAYMIFLQATYHDPLAFLKTQSIYHNWTNNTYANLVTSLQLSNLVFIILSIVAAVYWWNRRRSFSVYSLLFLLIPLVGKQYGGFDRYILMAFPMQLMFYGHFRHRKSYLFVVMLFTMVWTYYLLQYFGGYIGS